MDMKMNQTAMSFALTRLSLGLIFLAHGLLKIFVFTPAGTVGFFESLGLPAALAYFTIVAEILGGLMLMAGFKTKQVALLLLPVSVGAAWVYSGNGWMFAGADGGWEFPALLIALCAVVALQGTGQYSLDAKLSDNN